MTEIRPRSSRKKTIFKDFSDEQIKEIIDKYFKLVRSLENGFVIYAYLSGSKEILEPVFVKPGSLPCLEIADFVAYVMARYCFKRFKNETVDLPLKKLGNINYLDFEKGGDVLYSYEIVTHGIYSMARKVSPILNTNLELKCKYFFTPNPTRVVPI